MTRRNLAVVVLASAILAALYIAAWGDAMGWVNVRNAVRHTARHWQRRG